jgi:hypothetical protein
VSDDFARALHFTRRREALVQLVEKAIGKAVQRDVSAGQPVETLEHFDEDNVAVSEDLEDRAAASAEDLD